MKSPRIAKNSMLGSYQQYLRTPYSGMQVRDGRASHNRWAMPWTLGLSSVHGQAVVDKSAPVASAVLVSAMHMLGENTEVVKRWSSEIQEVVQSKHGMVQFHAVSLLHALRAKDRLAVSKLVSTLVKGNIRSPLAQCMLVRYVARVGHFFRCIKHLSWLPGGDSPSSL